MFIDAATLPPPAAKRQRRATLRFAAAAMRRHILLACRDVSCMLLLSWRYVYMLPLMLLLLLRQAAAFSLRYSVYAFRAERCRFVAQR